MGDRTRKLIELRARTDHDLLVLVQKELEAGFALVDTAITRNTPPFARAEKALWTAAMLLPRINSVSKDDRKRIEANVMELRSRLVSVPALVVPFLASVAS